MNCPEIVLKRDFSAFETKKHLIHPWFFQNSLDKVRSNIEPGQIVKVFDKKKNFICYGHYNPYGSIAVRALSFREDKFPELDFIYAKITKAFELRKNLKIKSDSYRLVFSESDELPGLIIDKFSAFAVLQTNTAGMDRIKNEISDFLIKNFSIEAVIERNDCEIRKIEKLPLKKAILNGKSPPSKLIITENEREFVVNLFDGQKTGFYLDQRDNRMEVAKFANDGMEVLDCFCFSGAFSVYCISSAKSLKLSLLDNSDSAILFAKENLELNGFSSNTANFYVGDAFNILRKFRDRGQKFDMIILDPPKFAPTYKDVDKASRGYKDINLLGMKLLKSEGILISFSCSSGISIEKFTEILKNAASDSGRKIQILKSLEQGPDHPVTLNFPESRYLKGFIMRVL